MGKMMILFLMLSALCEVQCQCDTFSDNKNSEELIDLFIMYRSDLSQEHFEKAYYNWKEVYVKAPAADGLRDHVYSDGQKLLAFQFRKTKKKKEKKRIVDLYYQLRKKQLICYPENELEKVPKEIEKLHNKRL